MGCIKARGGRSLLSKAVNNVSSRILYAKRWSLADQLAAGAYAGTAEVPPMTTSSLRLAKWLTEYAHLMRVIRSDAGRIWSGMAELFELYFLHTFHTFGDITIAALMSTQQQRQVSAACSMVTSRAHDIKLPELQ